MLPTSQAAPEGAALLSGLRDDRRNRTALLD
jgi:hypothetical protein